MIPTTLALWVLGVLSPLCRAAACANCTRTWPAFPLPSLINVQPEPSDFATQLVQRTLAGLAVRASLTRNDTPPLWIRNNAVADDRWRARFTQRNSAVMTANVDADVFALVQHYAALGVVRGFVVYSVDASGSGTADVSVNIATSLSAPFGAVAVADTLVAAAQAVGLKQLADARSMTYTDLGQFNFSRTVQTLLRTDQAHNRDMAVALNTLVTIDDANGDYTTALNGIAPTGVVIGYGTSEELNVGNASAHGAGLIAADWTSNWPVMAMGPTPALPSFARSQPAPVDDGASYYVAFVMTDGDNVQWVLGDYATAPLWYGAAARGAIPFTWGLPFATLAQTAPDALLWFQDTATANDAFVNYGDPYYYLDVMPAATVGAMVRAHQPWAHAADVHTAVVFAEQWNASAAQAGFNALAAADPALRAAFALQYSSYAAGEGALLRGGGTLPVLAPLTHLWDQPPSAQAGPPAHIAGLLNAWAAAAPGAPIAKRVAFVPVNAWSVFSANGSTVQGYAAAQLTAGMLASNIRLVTLPDIATLLNAAT